MKETGSIHWHCDNEDCRKGFELKERQRRFYRQAEIRGTLGEKRFFCSTECGRKGVREKMQWHCDNERCRKQFDLSYTQLRKLKRAEEGEDQKFYCSKSCVAVCIDFVAAQGRRWERDGLSLERLNAYWQKVQDPTYYTGIRHGYATPLSFRDKGIKMARSTNARS